MRTRGTIPIAKGSLLVLSIPLLLVFQDKTKASASTDRIGIIDQERKAAPSSLKRPDHLTAHDRKRSQPVVADLDNGGRAEYRRSGTQLTTTYFPTSAEVICELFYKLDNRGRPLKCDIYDESGEKAYKTSFGHSKRPVAMKLMEKPEPEAFVSPIEGGIGKLPPEMIDKLNHAHPPEKPIKP